MSDAAPSVSTATADATRYLVHATTTSPGGTTHTITTNSVWQEQGSDEELSAKQLVDVALSSCIAATVRIAADARNTALDEVSVDVSHVTADDGSTEFTVALHLTGDLSDKERAGLIRVAHHCPVSKMFGNSIEIGIVDADAATSG